MLIHNKYQLLLFLLLLNLTVLPVLIFFFSGWQINKYLFWLKLPKHHKSQKRNSLFGKSVFPLAQLTPPQTHMVGQLQLMLPLLKERLFFLNKLLCWGPETSTQEEKYKRHSEAPWCYWQLKHYSMPFMFISQVKPALHQYFRVVVFEPKLSIQAAGVRGLACQVSAS